MDLGEDILGICLELYVISGIDFKRARKVAIASTTRRRRRRTAHIDRRRVEEGQARRGRKWKDKL